MSTHRITLDDGFEIELELEQSPLLRWWSWTEYRWLPYRGREHEDHSEVVWLESYVGEHRVLPLGYPDGLHGRLLAWVEDGRFIARSAHSFFPILDDELAEAGVEEAHARVLESCSLQPSLL